MQQWSLGKGNSDFFGVGKYTGMSAVGGAFKHVTSVATSKTSIIPIFSKHLTNIGYGQRKRLGI
jgi:hypothetical protein